MPRPHSYFVRADDKSRSNEPQRAVMRRELFDEEAQEEARRWAAIKSAQLRRFFGQVMADRRQFELKGAQARDEEAQVAMALLKAATAYTAAREPARRPLAEFVAHHATLVKTIADFRAFARHFEAVVAWHKVFEKDGFPETSAARGPGGHAGGGGPGGAARQGGSGQRPGGGYQGRR